MHLSSESRLEHEVCSNTQTVWVNSSAGCCIGRFSKFGIDIHHDIDVQQETGKQCLNCTHSKPTEADWRLFIEQMLTVYGVEISEEHRPDWVDG